MVIVSFETQPRTDVVFRSALQDEHLLDAGLEDQHGELVLGVLGQELVRRVEDRPAADEILLLRNDDRGVLMYVQSVHTHRSPSFGNHVSTFLMR